MLPLQAMSISTPQRKATAARPERVSLHGDSDPRRWRILGILALAELLGMSLWFAASAVAPQLGARWTLSTGELGWLTAIVQLGFVLGTATSALLNLADVIPSRRLFAMSALL